MPIGAALVLFLAVGSPAAGQFENEERAGVIGLLTLPALLGTDPCKQPPPQQLALRVTPESRDAVAWIRPDKDPNSAFDCYQAVLNVHRRDGSVTPLPVEEYEEEAPHAAIVVAMRAGWFKLKLRDGAAWVHAPAQSTFLSLERLIGSHAAYLTDAWDGKLAATAGGEPRRAPADARRSVIGYVDPVLEELRIAALPGETEQEIRQRYQAVYVYSIQRPDGTRAFRIDRGAAVRAFERADSNAPVAASFQTDQCERTLRATPSNPPNVAVFDRRPGWLQVALRRDEWRDGWSDKWQDEPRVWIEDSPVWRFHSFADDGQREEFVREVLGPQFSSVRLTGARTIGGALWLRLELTTHPDVDPDDPPRVLASGWVPAHDPAGRPVVWFYTRD